MFSSSFAMSEQKHRQWTPYKQAAPYRDLYQVELEAIGNADQEGGQKHWKLRFEKRFREERRCQIVEEKLEPRSNSHTPSILIVQRDDCFGRYLIDYPT